MKLLCVMFFLAAAIPSAGLASENCAMMNGVCRDACNADEQILEGAFIDCGDKQECCIAKPQPRTQDKDSGAEKRPEQKQ